MRTNLRHLDANENAFLGRELESLDPRAFMTLFAGLLARRFVPTIPNIDPTDEAYSYTMWTVQGVTKSKATSKHAKDFPRVNVTKAKYSRTMKNVPASYGWGIDEIRAAARRGLPLEKVTVGAAMTAIARGIDTLLATGESGSDITGLLNNTNVDDTTAPVVKTGGGTAWSAASLPGEWIKDIDNLVAATRARLQQAGEGTGAGGEIPAVEKFTILLPQSHYTKLATTPRSDQSDMTPLKWLMQNNPWIESIEEWTKCATADGGNPRIVCYPRNEIVLGAVVPIDFESFEPKQEGMDVNVDCRGKSGGVVIRYPVACSYMDGV